ncbi:MAG: ATP-binding protein, partial [Merismopedia sp. SIO2A8]|nr:ATP-binding protein [Merismopedia sp. SIO2A8]
HATEFFGVLYDLIDPQRYTLACEWLRGDDVDEMGLSTLKVKQAIASEDAAQKVLANFGRIAADTQPIILCFDQLDNIARNEKGVIDLQALFNVNSSLHNQGLGNFLVIISIITSTWRQQSSYIQAAEQARIDQHIALHAISLNQAEALWAHRLAPLHHNATPKPDSTIVPFSRDDLERKFPGGKTNPRNVLELGRRLFQQAKEDAIAPKTSKGSGKKSSKKNLSSSSFTAHQSGRSKEDMVAAFRLLWRKELADTQERITRIRQLAAPDLLVMLQEVLSALKIDQVRSRLLPSQTYTNQSLSYPARPTDQLPPHSRIGVVWNDDPNMTTFYHVMNACRRVVDLRLCHTLYLIRSGPVGKPNRKSHRLYQEIFDGNPHKRLRVDLLSIHYLATYHQLVNAAYARELMVAGELVNLTELESLIRKARILRNCRLLQDLGIVWGRPRRTPIAEDAADPIRSTKDLEPIRELLLDLVKAHRILGVSTLIKTAADQFPYIPDAQWQDLIKTLSKAKRVKILDPTAKLEAQLICWTDA